MKLTDYLAMAGHSLHRSFDTAGTLFTAAAVTVLCFSGAILTTIHDEKAAPCELSVTAPSYLAITEQSIQDFRAIADVMDATGTVEMPVTAVSGKYAASLTLVGIDGDLEQFSRFHLVIRRGPHHEIIQELCHIVCPTGAVWFILPLQFFKQLLS